MAWTWSWDGDSTSATEPRWTYVLTLLETAIITSVSHNTLWVQFDGRYDFSLGALHELSEVVVAITFSRVSTFLLGLDEFKVFLLLIILQVVRMITTSKDGFCDKSGAEFWTAWKIGFSSCDVDLSVSLEKIDSALFVGWQMYVAADWLC